MTGTGPSMPRNLRLRYARKAVRVRPSDPVSPPDEQRAPVRPDLPGPVPCWGILLRLFTSFDSDSVLRDGAGELVDTGFSHGQYPAAS
jgi:hypothetical protein